MILVTGATGHLGGAVIQHLREKIPADQIVALVRNADKASDLQESGVRLCVGDYDDTASLDAAMENVETVLLIAGTDEENRVRQHQNVINAAKKVGVRRIAYTSRTLKDRNTLVNKLMEGHFETEDAVKSSGLNYLLFRNVLYMDTLPQFVGGEKVFENGLILPTGKGRVPFALRSEMGKAIAHALLTSDETNKTYTLTASESYSFADVAAALSDLSGKTVRYTPVEKSAFEADLKERGLPDVMIGRITGFMTDIKNGQEDEISPDMENLLGRKPTALKDGLKTLFHL